MSNLAAKAYRRSVTDKDIAHFGGGAEVWQRSLAANPLNPAASREQRALLKHGH